TRSYIVGRGISLDEPKGRTSSRLDNIAAKDVGSLVSRSFQKGSDPFLKVQQALAKHQRARGRNIEDQGSRDGTCHAEGSQHMTTKQGTGVPLCDVQGQYRAIQAPILEAISRVLASGQVILGPEVKAFEDEMAAYLGAGHAIACGSGTDAITLALLALDIGPGDEVILPPFTFFATAGCVSRLGPRPGFADIDPATHNLHPLPVA